MYMLLLLSEPEVLLRTLEAVIATEAQRAFYEACSSPFALDWHEYSLHIKFGRQHLSAARDAAASEPMGE